MKKTKKILAAAALFTAVFALDAQAGWEQDASGQYSYLMDSGAYARDQLLEIDGATYGFNSSAYMMTGWNQISGDWYYFDESGAMAKGWKELGGTWYYLNPSTGVMKTGKFKIGANLYGTDASGALQVNKFFDGLDGYAYRSDESGVIYRNKSEEDNAGNIFVYEDDGRIRIANTSTRNIAKAESGNFLSEDYLTMENYEAFRNGIVTHAEEAVGSVMDDLYENYLDVMQNVTSSKKRQTKREKWENRATNRLKELSQTDEDINTFIREVESGTYLPYGEVDESNYNDAYDYDYDDDYDE